MVNHEIPARNLATTRSAGVRPCLFHGTERHGTERNAGLFHGTDKCDRGTINLILEYLTRNGLIRICKVRTINYIIRILNTERICITRNGYV